jgi:hypothetical protein
MPPIKIDISAYICHQLCSSHLHAQSIVTSVIFLPRQDEVRRKSQEFRLPEQVIETSRLHTEGAQGGFFEGKVLIWTSFYP